MLKDQRQSISLIIWKPHRIRYPIAAGRLVEMSPNVDLVAEDFTQNTNCSVECCLRCTKGPRLR